MPHASLEANTTWHLVDAADARWMLALMASLVATAGFVQGISRKGVFYCSMDQRAVAHHAEDEREHGALVAPEQDLETVASCGMFLT